MIRRRLSNLVVVSGLLLFPTVTQAFPVAASTASQSLLWLILLLFGAGGAANHQRLRVACLILVTIIGFQAYRQATLLEGMRMSQEHEYFVPKVTGFARVPMLSYQDLLARHESTPSAKIIHLSHDAGLIHPEILSTQADFSELPFRLETNEPLYVLSMDVEAASHTVERWQAHHKNIWLVPYSTDDIARSVTLPEGVSAPEITPETLSPNYETVHHMLSGYNVITLAVSTDVTAAAPMDSILLYTSNLPFYSDHFWDSIKSSLDTDKPTLIITPKRKPKDPDSFTPFVAHKLNLSHVLFSRTVADWNEAHRISADNFITPGYRHQSRFLSQTEVYAHQDNTDNTLVVCFSEPCLNYFPESRSALWTRQDLLSISPEGRYQIQLPADASHNQRYILAPMGSEESSLALRVGHALVAGQYDLEGFTYHPANYYGATYYRRTGEMYFDDNFLTYDRHLQTALHWLTPTAPLIRDMATLLSLGALLGLLISIPGAARWLGAVALVYLSAFFSELVHLPLQHYQAFMVTPPILAGLFVLTMLPSLTRTTALSLTLAVIGVYYGSGYLLLPMDRFLGAVLLAAASVSTLVIAIRGARRLSGLKRPRLSSPALGSKCRDTLPWVPERLTGFIIARQNVSGRFLPGSSRQAWILRSNHRDHREQALAGCFESYHVTKATLGSVVTEAYEQALEHLPANRIQFWLQPVVKSKIHGVASSHDLTRPGAVRIEYGPPDAITEGVGGHVAQLARWKKPGLRTPSWQKRLLAMLKRIEQQTGEPCVVEFAIKGSTPIVLQVRCQPQAADQDLSELQAWRTSERSLKPCETMMVSRYGKLVLFHLYGGTVLVDNETALRKPVTRRDTLDVGPCHLAFQTMATWRKTGRHLTLPVTRLISKLAAVLSTLPLTTLSDHKLDKPGQDLYESIHHYLVEHHLTLANDMDAGSAFMDVGTAATPLSCASSRDLAHALMSLAVVIARECASYKRVSNWQNTTPEAIDDGEPGPEEVFSHDTSHRQARILVRGDFSGPRINLKEFLKLAEEQQREYVLEEAIIPGTALGQALKAKAIIVGHATELSHIAISCQQSGTPLQTSAGMT